MSYVQLDRYCCSFAAAAAADQFANRWLSLQAPYLNQQAHLCFSVWTFLQFRQINLKLFLQMSQLLLGSEENGLNLLHLEKTFILLLLMCIVWFKHVLLLAFERFLSHLVHSYRYSRSFMKADKQNKQRQLPARKRHGLYDENPLAPAQKTDW
ncbi:hypothetical protein T09_10892 [Trichinella sp. T9]|nr:hypothetical protein T09_10892 [Trichinella sp. T9]